MRNFVKALGTAAVAAAVWAMSGTPARGQDDIAGLARKAAGIDSGLLDGLSGLEATSRHRMADLSLLRELAAKSGDAERVRAIDELMGQQTLLDQLSFDAVRRTSGDDAYTSALSALRLGSEREKQLAPESLNSLLEKRHAAAGEAMGELKDKGRGLLDKESVPSAKQQESVDRASDDLEGQGVEQRTKARDLLGEARRETRAKAESLGDQARQEVRARRDKRDAEADPNESKIPTKEEAKAAAAERITEDNADEVFERLQTDITRQLAEISQEGGKLSPDELLRNTRSSAD